MHRRKFLLTPVALASLWGCAQTTTQSGDNAAQSRVALVFSDMSTGSSGLWRNVGTLRAGGISIEVDLWLRLDIDPPPAGGVLIRPAIRITEDSAYGRTPILESDQLQGKSAPNSNVVHITGRADGFSHDNLRSPLGLDFSIRQAVYFNPTEQSGAKVSTVPGKDSYIIVTTS